MFDILKPINFFFQEFTFIYCRLADELRLAMNSKANKFAILAASIYFEDDKK